MVLSPDSTYFNSYFLYCETTCCGWVDIIKTNLTINEHMWWLTVPHPPHTVQTTQIETNWVYVIDRWWRLPIRLVPPRNSIIQMMNARTSADIQIPTNIIIQNGKCSRCRVEINKGNRVGSRIYCGDCYFMVDTWSSNKNIARNILLREIGLT